MRFVHIEMCGECQMHTPFQRLSVEKKKKCKITRVFFFFLTLPRLKYILKIFLKLISLVSFCYFHVVTRIFKIPRVACLQFTSYPCWTVLI